MPLKLKSAWNDQPLCWNSRQTAASLGRGSLINHMNWLMLRTNSYYYTFCLKSPDVLHTHTHAVLCYKLHNFMCVLRQRGATTWAVVCYHCIMYFHLHMWSVGAMKLIIQNYYWKQNQIFVFSSDFSLFIENILKILNKQQKCSVVHINVW